MPGATRAQAPPRRPLLAVEDLRVRAGATAAVRGVSLTVGDGETVCLAGVNGAGKTTTLHGVAGLVRPASGSVVLRGRDVAGARPATIARMGVRLVPERQRVLSALSVEENLAAGAVTAPAHDAGLDAVYALFPGLGRRRSQPAAGLSAGERRMLALGRALVAGPSLLLLDEPSLGMAPRAADELYAALAAINARGTAVLLADDPRRALAVARRGYVIDGGEIVGSGAADDVRAALAAVEAAP